MPILTNNLLDLPDEMLVKIAKYINIPEWCNLRLTCKRLDNVINTNRTIKTNILLQESVNLPTEVLNRYWDYDSGVVHLQSTRITESVWKKVMDICPQSNVMILTDCHIANYLMPTLLRPEMLKLIRCTGYNYGLLERFAKYNNKATSFYVEAGLLKKDWREVLKWWLDKAFFLRDFGINNDLPIRLTFEDSKSGEVEVISVTKEERQSIAMNENPTNNKRQHFNLLVVSKVSRQRLEDVTFGVTFSRGEDEDTFKFVLDQPSVETHFFMQVKSRLEHFKIEKELQESKDALEGAALIKRQRKRR